MNRKPIEAGQNFLPVRSLDKTFYSPLDPSSNISFYYQLYPNEIIISIPTIRYSDGTIVSIKDIIDNNDNYSFYTDVVTNKQRLSITLAAEFLYNNVLAQMLSDYYTKPELGKIIIFDPNHWKPSEYEERRIKIAAIVR